jgi:tRNA 2-selenouridine synthase
VNQELHHLHKPGPAALVDVRSPVEFAYGHIPGAINYPLFNDEERVIIGKLYKKEGRDKAVLKGLEIVGPRMHLMVKDFTKMFPEKRLIIHCWRGGMRSNSVSWLLRQAGFEINTLSGGYKHYRSLVREFLASPFNLRILNGPTGSGKTDVLKALKDLGEQVIDLEGLANHKGSSFGAIGQLEQPSIEQFENNLANELLGFNPERVIWVEDESRKIGRVSLGDHFWNQMLSANYIRIAIPQQERVKRLVEDYGKYSQEDLEKSILRIGKRLGPQHLKTALEQLSNGMYDKVANTCLVYYDKAYAFGLEKKKTQCLAELNFDHSNVQLIAETIKNSRL